MTELLHLLGIAAVWLFFGSIAGVWGITYALRFFVVRGRDASDEPAVNRPFRNPFVKKASLNERGLRLWKIRNGLIVTAVILLPILWSLPVQP